MKLTRYITLLFIALMVCVSVLAKNINQEYKSMSEQITGLKWQIETLQAENVQYKNDIKALAEQIEAMQERIERKQDKSDRGGERGRIMEVTAYWEGSCGKAPDHPLYGVTASGEYVQDGFVAAWLEEYPIGTRLYIPELDRVFTVMDCGGAITEGHLDLYMTTEKECFKFGRQWLEVYRVE
jgi:3D (Asp-Asp-Asp) domain-containing protein